MITVHHSMVTTDLARRAVLERISVTESQFACESRGKRWGQLCLGEVFGGGGRVWSGAAARYREIVAGCEFWFLDRQQGWSRVMAW